MSVDTIGVVINFLAAPPYFFELGRHLAWITEPR